MKHLHYNLAKYFFVKNYFIFLIAHPIRKLNALTKFHLKKFSAIFSI